YHWTPPTGTTGATWVRTDTFYDGAGRSIATFSAHYANGGPTVWTGGNSPRTISGGLPAVVDYDANSLTSSRTFYNVLGKVDHTVDDLGNSTYFEYDIRGNLIETRYPDGTVTRTTYDVMGRVQWQSEQFKPAANPANEK